MKAVRGTLTLGLAGVAILVAFVGLRTAYLGVRGIAHEFHERVTCATRAC